MSFADEHLAETYKSLMLYGSAGLKFVLTANGAAAIAVMTFLGHFNTALGVMPPMLQAPLTLFVGGVFLGGVATATTYLTQLSLYGEAVSRSPPMSWYQSHVLWLRTSITLILGGIMLFGIGSFWTVARLQ